MPKTVKATRCESRHEGDGALCVLPEGHACPHQVGGHQWASEHSGDRAELARLRRSLRALFESIEVDATLPEIRYTSQFLLDELRRYFPELKRTPPKLTITR